MASAVSWRSQRRIAGDLRGYYMSSIVFTLVFGLLAGIAGFVGTASFEMVLVLGLLGLLHLSVVAARKENAAIVREEDIQR
jgi:asparagine N-glycosylation enzyme membrane subunit Stt3